MKTATRPDDLVILGQLLQADLQSELLQNIPIQVRCLPKDGTLAILVQHRAQVDLDSQQIFAFLEQKILSEHRSVSSQVKIYLRVAGEKQPYAYHSLRVEPLDESMAVAMPVEEVPEAAGIPDSSAAAAVDSTSVEKPTSTNESATASALPHPWDEPILEENAQAHPPGQDNNETKHNPVALQQPTGEMPGASPEALSEEAPTKRKKKLNPTSLPLIVAGVGLSLVAFSASVFVLSRPCVIGACQVISDAKKLSNQSAQTFQNPQSGKEILEAQQQIRSAIGLLETIPSWSSQHSQAQELIKAYELQAARVDEMVSALKTAARASYKSENPPHASSTWIEIQTLWREAIAQLEELPTKSNLQPLAQQKIKTYQANLAQTNQRLSKERQAQGTLQAAKDAALIAEARQGVAQSPDHWQLVYGTWQTAMKRLKEIPQGTTAYEEAQQLTAQYLPKVASARDRQTEEQIAAKAYNQGLHLAQLAQTSQLNNQWSAALSNWRNALSYVNQVPSGTFYYGKAQLLASSYSKAVKQAQGQLQLAVKLQQTRSDLKQTCSGKAQICDFTVTYNLITVRLTPTYVQLVRQTALNAKVNSDPKAQSGLVNHVLTLGQALEAISDNARIPLQVYDPDGSLIKEHVPGT